jgi:hypothetical protein
MWKAADLKLMMIMTEQQDADFYNLGTGKSTIQCLQTNVNMFNMYS